MQAEREREIRTVLGERVKPVLRAHRGDIELTGIGEDRVVRLRLLGACATCRGAEETIREVVVDSIRASCPWVEDVRVETGVSRELMDEALRFLRKGRP